MQIMSSATKPGRARRVTTHALAAVVASIASVAVIDLVFDLELSPAFAVFVGLAGAVVLRVMDALLPR